MGMTIKQLEYVIAVVKHGSLSQAAANLYISQPTLPEGLQNLEELGFPIFQRRRAGPSRTVRTIDAGKTLDG